ncbi:hypothetical protein A1O3_05839 [Capronia epimyces CBS 606.96]|uniref:DUF1917-domain-containing protein n=1 Tax=Capronia epimyces CBS 606.96 TaxID=1182542 RepID=W9YSA2_9EURO|nr:uncharacterized protein A1O3_05839 [Capronia epimyces CBS 606.96]EXJ85164.1 hypothetical protein A1O3_05839 [Capronia epimyces CBS 606.96]
MPQAPPTTTAMPHAPAPPTEASSSTAEILVSIPDDLFSEESDFYGNSNSSSKSHYTKQAAAYDPDRYWAVHHWNAQVVAVRGKKAQKRAARLRAKKDAEKRAQAEAEAAAEAAAAEAEGEAEADNGEVDGAQPAVDQEQKRDNVKDEDEEATQSPDDRMVVDNYNDHKDSLDTTAAPASPTPRPQNFYEGQKNAKQLSELVADFLARLPPSTTTISTGGPWIWIANPYPSRHIATGMANNNTNNKVNNANNKVSNASLSDRNRINVPESGNIQTFKQLGLRLLDKYTSRKREVEAQNPGKAAGTITRLLRSERTHLEAAILDLARTTHVTCGKWMLFPSPDDVDRVWAVVAHGTWDGRLGISAKVAVAETETNTSTRSETETATNTSGASNRGHDGDSDPARKQQQHRLICIYTSDFEDKADVKRVLVGMKDLGLLNTKGGGYGSGSAYFRAGGGDGGGGGAGTGGLMTIYYKCDAYTWLDITSGNEYKLKASLYCSKDFLDDGPALGSSTAAGYFGYGKK